MSKRRSVRVALWATAGVVAAGAISLLAVPASAGAPTITYDGHCGLLATSSSSEPDKSSVTTQEGSSGRAEVTVVNDTGTSATPFANGKAMTWSDGQRVVIQDGQSLNVPFASGPVELTLVPKCDGLLTLSKKHEAATINVQEAPDAPRGGNPDTPADKPGSGDTPGEKPDAGDRPDAPKDPVASGAVPPEGDEGSVGPDDGDSPEDSVGAPADGDNKADGDGEAAPMVPTNHNRGPGTTTLALVAVVCLLGVGVAALRTIVVARAARASF